MDSKTIFLIVLGMTAVTYFSRSTPILLLSNRKMPDLVIRWLRYVSVAVLSALLLPTLLVQDNRVTLSLTNLFLLAAIPTGFVAWKTRSLFGAAITGMALVALGRLII
jgi:branched-subunit amino acid transport protein